MAEKRAFVAREDQAGWCTVVFAETRGEARYKGAGKLDVDFIAVGVNRAPDLDKFVEKGRVPRKLLVEKHGWWVKCTYCNAKVGPEDSLKWHGDFAVCERHPDLNKDGEHGR